MTAVLEAPVLTGVQAPRIDWSPPDACRSRGLECADWASAVLGIELDPWQVLVLDRMMALRPEPSEQWAALEVGLTMPRQNGKSLVLAVRELFGMLVLGERTILHTAHRARTSKNAYRETRRLLREAPGWVNEGKNIGHLGGVWIVFRDANGEESVTLEEGRTGIEFSTRTAGGGRGLSPDLVVFDEAQDLDQRPVDALLFALSAQTVTGNPQVIYTGSAGTVTSTAQAQIRRRGLTGQRAKRLTYQEWSVDEAAWLALPVDVRRDAAATKHLWPQANPALGLRISEEWVEETESGLDMFSFARERLGVGSWPADDVEGGIIPRSLWDACAEPDTEKATGRLVLAIGASYDQTVSVAVCGKRPDGMVVAELTREPRKMSAAQVVTEMRRLTGAYPLEAVIVDEKGPIKFAVPDLEAAGVPLQKVTFQDCSQAMAGLVAAVVEDPPQFRHRDDPAVFAALTGARKREIEGGWVLDRGKSLVDVTPLEVVALARWGHVAHGDVDYDVMASAY